MDRIQITQCRVGPGLHQMPGHVLVVGRDVGDEEAGRLVAAGQAVWIDGGGGETATAPAAPERSVAPEPKAKPKRAKKRAKRSAQKG